MMTTLGAPCHMPAERLCPAGFNRRHDLELGEADMSRIGQPPVRALSAKDVSDLQLGPVQRAQLLLGHWKLCVNVGKLHCDTGSPDVKMS